MIADSVLRMQAHKQHPEELLWPRVIAVIAFDTPVSMGGESMRPLAASLHSWLRTVSRTASACLRAFRSCLRSWLQILIDIFSIAEKRDNEIHRPHRDGQDGPLYRLWVLGNPIGRNDTNQQDGKCSCRFLLFLLTDPTVPLKGVRGSSRWSGSCRDGLLAKGRYPNGLEVGLGSCGLCGESLGRYRDAESARRTGGYGQEGSDGRDRVSKVSMSSPESRGKICS